MKEQNRTELSLTQKINQVLGKNRVLLFVLAGLMVAVVIGAVVLDRINQKRVQEATVQAEEVVDLFVEWKSGDIEDQVLLDYISSTLEDYSGTFAEQRALFSRGQYYIDTEMWSEAAADFIALADQYPQSYLAPVALFNAAGTVENAGDLQLASEYFERLVNDYSQESPEIPEAIFNLGRIAEAQGDVEKAIEYYDRLVLDFSGSDWTNLAKSRILSLNL